MPHQVKVYSGHPDNGGKLKKIIREEDLIYQDDPAHSKKRNRYKGSGKERPEKMVCLVCERTVSFENFGLKVCRKVACMEEWELIKERRRKAVNRG